MRALLVAALLCAAAPAWCQQPASDDALLTVSGPNGLDLRISAQDWAELPAHHLHLAFQTGHGEEATDYAGVSLWDLLIHTSSVPPTSPKEHVRLVARVSGRDGWTVAVAVAELDPDFEGKEVLLAHALDASGAERGELRLVVPGDRHGARDVRDVVRVDVR